MQRELPSDAGAFPVAEGLVEVAGAAVGLLRVEAGGVEQLGVVAPGGVAVEHRGEHGERLALVHGVTPADDGVLQGFHGEGGGGGPQPQALVEHLAQIVQPSDVLVCGVGVRVRPPQRVGLGAGRREHGRVLEQVVEGEGEGAAGGLVSGDQEGEHLVADVHVVERLAGVLVLGVQHQPEQVVGAVRAAVARRAAAAHDVVGEPVHGLDVDALAGLGAPAEEVQPGYERVLPLGVVERGDHRGDEGVRGGALEALEVMAEAAEADGVEGEPGHVLGHVDGGARVPVPGVEDSAGHGHHRGVVGPQGVVGERGHQDVVRLAPVGLVAEGGEEAVPGELPYGGDGLDGLAETGLVAQFGDQLGARDHPAVGVEEPQVEEGTEGAGLTQGVLGEAAGRDAERVTEERQPGALGHRARPRRGADTAARGAGAAAECCRRVHRPCPSVVLAGAGGPAGPGPD